MLRPQGFCAQHILRSCTAPAALRAPQSTRASARNSGTMLKLHRSRVTSGCGQLCAHLWRQRCLLRILLSREDEQIRVRLAQELSHFLAPVATTLACPQQASGGYLYRLLRQLPAAVDKYGARWRLAARPLFRGVLRHHLSLFLARVLRDLHARRRAFDM